MGSSCGSQFVLELYGQDLIDQARKDFGVADDDSFSSSKTSDAASFVGSLQRPARLQTNGAEALSERPEKSRNIAARDDSKLLKR